MLRLSCTVAFLAFADGALLRKASLQIEGDPKSPEEIHKKWDKMDDFLETMFVMACNSKHGKDVNGLAAEKLKSGDIVGSKALKSFKTKTQDANVDGVFRACGMIVSKGKKKCRESCSTRFGTMSSEVMQERADCDKMCVERYASFEKSCRSKADNLKTVYDIKNKMAEAKKQCHESHCAKYPTVWMKEKDDMSAEVDSQCEKACTEDRVKVQCEHKFNLEIDFQMAKIKSDCQAEGKVSECFSKEKESLSGEADTCSSKGKSDCDDSHSKCDTDKNSGDFCNERKKMCLEQVDKNCLKKHESALKDAKATCEEDDSERQKTCVNKKAKEEEEKEVAGCVEKRMPSCDDDCHASCNTDKMNTCLDNLGSTSDATADFCTDFWHLLHESSEIDPETGRPII